MQKSPIWGFHCFLVCCAKGAKGREREEPRIEERKIDLRAGVKRCEATMH